MVVFNAPLADSWISGWTNPMFGQAASHPVLIISFFAFMTSALLGLIRKGKLRTFIILILWFVPLILAVCLTFIAPREIQDEFGDWWALLAVSPFFLAAWSIVTLFPFKLVARLREVQLGE